MEDPLDAFQLLLVACGDPVKRLVVVLKSTATLAAGNRRSVLVTSRDKHGGGDLHVDGVGHLHVSHLHQPGEVHLLLHLPLTPHLHRRVSGLQLSLEQGGGGGGEALIRSG